MEQQIRDAENLLGNKQDALAQLDLYKKLKAHLENEEVAFTFGVSKEQVPFIRELQLITGKPAFYIANVAEEGFENNPYLKKLEEIANKIIQLIKESKYDEIVISLSKTSKSV